MQKRKEFHQSQQAMACCRTNLQTTKASKNKGLCLIFCICLSRVIGFAGDSSGEEPACQCRRHSPWVHKIPWRRAWQPTHYSCLEESGRLKSQTKLKQLSTHAHQGLFGELCSFLLFRDLGRPSGYHLECGQVLARGREIIVLKLRLNTPAKLINKPSTQNSLAITGHNLPILRVWRCHSTCV